MKVQILQYIVVNQKQSKRGDVFDEENVEAYLPVADSFWFTAHLKSLTSVQAFPQLVFSHWDIINQDPFDVKSLWNYYDYKEKRKGLKQEFPVLTDYIDKI